MADAFVEKETKISQITDNLNKSEKTNGEMKK